MYDCYGHEYTTAQDEIYPLVEKWRAILDEYISADGVPRYVYTCTLLMFVCVCSTVRVCILITFSTRDQLSHRRSYFEMVYLNIFILILI